jgi:predicted lactoylglutathione lyase
VLAAIGKNRDKLAEKKSLVESILTDVREAIIGNANISNFVEQQAKTVTEATTKIVGGLSVTTTRTLEVLSTQNNIVSGFQTLLTKTRTFVANLKQLRALGLSTDLFKQIVDAGVDSGNATAEALIAGGAGTITEVNNLYKDIQEQAGIAAEQTAQALYGQGIDLTKGIMAGIVSQETALVALADDLGNKFADAFATKVTEAIRVAADAFATAQQTDGLSEIGDPMLTAGSGGIGGGRMLMAASVGRAKIVEQLPIQVNLTLDSRQVAQGLVKLEKQSGSIWVRA